MPDLPVTMPKRLAVGQENTSVGSNCKGEVPRSIDPVSMNTPISPWPNIVPLSAPSSCCFSHGMKKSTGCRDPSSLIFMFTAACSSDVGGCRPGTGISASCEAYPFPVA